MSYACWIETEEEGSRTVKRCSIQSIKFGWNHQLSPHPKVKNKDGQIGIGIWGLKFASPNYKICDVTGQSSECSVVMLFAAVSVSAVVESGVGTLNLEVGLFISSHLHVRDKFVRLTCQCKAAVQPYFSEDSERFAGIGGRIMISQSGAVLTFNIFEQWWHTCHANMWQSQWHKWR